MSGFRIDSDSLGEIEVSSDAYFGPFTARAMKQYKVTGQRAHINFIKAYAIIRACEEILAGKLVDQFVVESINSGAGTAFNMNSNEVIANRALEILGNKKGEYDVINPNDHVNMSQSSNDTFPTAMHMAILFNINDTISALDRLIQSLSNKGEEFRNVIKIGRTHLMDALPVTLGSEFETYAYSLLQSKLSIIQVIEELQYVGLGATAVGTGANAPRGYKEIALDYLSKISRLNLKPSPNMFYSLQSKYVIASCSSALRNLAIELSKIANDLRLMASGPTAGLAEILIPAVHAGSSIMPGKVNPSLAECLNMICFNIIGNDVSVAMAAQAGQFELNVMLPGMLKCVLDSTDMLKNFLPIFAANLVDGIEANKDRLASYIEKSPVLVTLLNPFIGYLRAAEIYKESLKSNKSIRELILSKGLMTKEQLDKVLSRENILGFTV